MLLCPWESGTYETRDAGMNLQLLGCGAEGLASGDSREILTAQVWVPTHVKGQAQERKNARLQLPSLKSPAFFSCEDFPRCEARPKGQEDLSTHSSGSRVWPVLPSAVL